MAFSSTTIVECRSTAAAGNVNGGTWNPAGTGTDWSQQDAAQYNLTGGTSAGAGSVILHASASADMVGNGLYLVSGTNATVSWYQIVSVVAGVSITVDRACTTGVGASIVFNIGGAWSLCAANDGTCLALMPAAYYGTIWIKAGTYPLIASWNLASIAGDHTNGVWRIQGYNSTRGDNPTGSNRPLLTHYTNLYLIPGAFVEVSNLNIVCRSNAGYGALSLYGSYGRIINCRLVNNHATANLTCTNMGQYCMYIRCELSCANGYAAGTTISSQSFVDCYFHDSNYAIGNTYTVPGSMMLEGCIFEGITTACFQQPSGAINYNFIIKNCTFYGGETLKLGTGVLMLGTTSLACVAILYNNIFYGLATAISNGALSNINYENNNNFYNNTTDRTNWVTGPGSIALNPQFASVGQYVAKGTVTSSGFVLTDTGQTFANVVPGRDYINIISMTGGSGPGVYSINATNGTTTVTCDNTLGSSSAITYSIIWGHNLSVGTNMKAAGLGGANQYSTSYVDMGAVQRQEAGGGAYTFGG